MHNPVNHGSVTGSEDEPQVILGGVFWPVPVLSARQNKIIDPLILSLLPLFTEWHADKMAALGKLDTAHYEALQQIAFHAIRKSHPELTHEAFLELPITLPELVTAFAVIARQTGVFERAAPGEAQAGIAPPNP